MKRLNQHINPSAAVAKTDALFIANSPSSESACPEITGALRVAYGASLQVATGLNYIDS